MNLDGWLPWMLWLTVAGWSVTLGVLLTVVVWHHRRWVAYYQRKRLPLPASWQEVLWIEAVDGIRLAIDYLRGLFRDGLRRPAQVRGPTVLCVHGYTQNATNFVRIRQALESDGRPTLAVSLWHRVAPLAWYQRRLERELERAVRLEEGGIDVVCHSMGGVLLRAVLHRRPDLAERVGTAVTLGSPHRGTAAARGIPLLPEVQALKRGSDFLDGLPPLSELVRRSVSVAGRMDTIVYPQSSAMDEGGDQVVVDAGHVGLLTRPEAVQAVRDALATAA